MHTTKERWQQQLADMNLLNFTLNVQWKDTFYFLMWSRVVLFWPVLNLKFIVFIVSRTSKGIFKMKRIKLSCSLSHFIFTSKLRCRRFIVSLFIFTLTCRVFTGQQTITLARTHTLTRTHTYTVSWCLQALRLENILTNSAEKQSFCASRPSMKQATLQSRLP